jgi:hypothetical protein
MLLSAPIRAPIVLDAERICADSDVEAPNTEELVLVTLVLIVPSVLPNEDEELRTLVFVVKTLVLAVAIELPNDVDALSIEVPLASIELDNDDELFKTLVLTPEIFVLMEDVACAIRASVLAFTFV